MSTQPKSVQLPDPDKVYRVVQWATGRIGEVSLRDILRSPQFELVGVYVHSEAKEGRDAGELCGLPSVGVAATRDIEKLIALKPDCVVAVQEGANVDDVCRFLEAGINVATSRVDYLSPDIMKAELRKRIEDACRKGRSSIHASGSSPGFSSEALPLTAVSMSRRMDRMTIDEYADFPASCPDFQCLAVGFGRPAGTEFDPRLVEHTAHGFRHSVNTVAKALGLTLDDTEVFAETAGARKAYALPGGTAMDQGSVAAMRVTISGMKDGKPLITFRVNWYTTKDLDADWNLRENGWRLLVEGDTPIDINVTFPVSGEKLSPAMAGLTAFRVLNAVPYVCAAEPGIRTTPELPNIVPKMA
jgi:hypothetical protein